MSAAVRVRKGEGLRPGQRLRRGLHIGEGKVAVGGCGFDIAAGASVSAEAILKVGASVCVDASLDAAGDIAACGVTAN